MPPDHAGPPPSAPGFHHEDHPRVVTRHARYGLVLFAIYLALYAAFVALAVFRPGWMAAVGPAGVNVAVLWGLGLILGAVVLALIYMFLCRPMSIDGPSEDKR